MILTVQGAILKEQQCSNALMRKQWRKARPAAGGGTHLTWRVLSGELLSARVLEYLQPIDFFFFKTHIGLLRL